MFSKLVESLCFKSIFVVV